MSSVQPFVRVSFCFSSLKLEYIHIGKKVHLHGWGPVSSQLLYCHQFCWAPCRLFRRSLYRSSRWFPRCQWDPESCQRQSISLIAETSSGEIAFERGAQGSVSEKKVAAGRGRYVVWHYAGRCAYTVINPCENLIDILAKSSAEGDLVQCVSTYKKIVLMQTNELVPANV